MKSGYRIAKSLFGNFEIPEGITIYDEPAGGKGEIWVDTDLETWRKIIRESESRNPGIHKMNLELLGL